MSPPLAATDPVAPPAGPVPPCRPSSWFWSGPPSSRWAGSAPPPAPSIPSRSCHLWSWAPGRMGYNMWISGRDRSSESSSQQLRNNSGYKRPTDLLVFNERTAGLHFAGQQQASPCPLRWLCTGPSDCWWPPGGPGGWLSPTLRTILEPPPQISPEWSRFPSPASPTSARALRPAPSCETSCWHLLQLRCWSLMSPTLSGGCGSSECLSTNINRKVAQIGYNQKALSICSG